MEFSKLMAAVGLLTVTSTHAANPIVKLDGSSTVYPVSEAVAEEFQKATQREIRVTVGISGTGGGFKKLCRGEIDVSNASRPILKKEMELCAQAGIQYIELPIAYDALTVVVNRQNDWLESISVEQLRKIWEPGAQGKITRWNQVNPAWPDIPLKLYGPGADSGTFDYFTEAVMGKSKSSRGDFTASEDDNVLVQGVSRDWGALGYFGFSYYLENRHRLKALPIAAKSAKPAVAPTFRTIEDGSYTPFSRPIFIYVNAEAARKPEVRRFVSFYLDHAAELVKEVLYVPLPAKAYQAAFARFNKRKSGTVFGGEPDVNVSVGEMLAREPRL